LFTLPPLLFTHMYVCLAPLLSTLTLHIRQTPNCIYTETATGMTVTALRSIPANTELTISYLSLHLYAPASTRQSVLSAQKFFTCECERCTTRTAGEARIPCPSCHPRAKAIAEEVEFEEVPVTYLTVNQAKGGIMECRTCKSARSVTRQAIGLTSTSKKNVTSEKRAIGSLARTCGSLTPLCTGNEEIADTSAPVKLCLAVGRQVGEFLLEGGEEGAGEEEKELEEQELQAMCSSVCGARHWTTNMMALMAVDRALQRINACLMLGDDFDEVDLAEAIDNLTRLWEFASEAGLGEGGAARLLVKQVCSVSRALVALGDAKSVKFGQEWALKCREYVEVMGAGEGMEVVWKKLWEGGEGEEGGAGAKKQRVK